MLSFPVSSDTSDSESDSDVDSVPTVPQSNVPIKVSKSSQFNAEQLIRLIKGNPQQLEGLFDKDQMIANLQKIVDIDITVKTTNPNVYCYYEMDVHRSGHFAADCTTSLSTYLANVICDSKFSYSDVLGKHSEHEFSISDVSMTYLDTPDERRQEEHYKLYMNDPRLTIDSSFFEIVRKGLKKHMKKLEPIKPSDFENGRYEELLEYGRNLLENAMKTNDPTIRLVKQVPRSKMNSDSWNRTESVEMSIPLSELLALMKMKYHVDVRSEYERDEDKRWPHSAIKERVFPISSMTMVATQDKPWHSRHIPWDDKDFKTALELLRKHMKILLSHYDPDTAEVFFKKHFEALKTEVMQ